VADGPAEFFGAEGRADAVPDDERVDVGLGLGEPDRLGLLLGLGLDDGEPAGLDVGVVVGVGVTEPVPLPLGVGDGEPDPLPLGVGDGEPVEVGVAEGEGVDDDGDGDGDGDVVDGEDDAEVVDGEGDGEGVADAAGELDGLNRGLAVADDGLDRGLAVADEVGAGDGEALASAGSGEVTDSPETRKPPATRLATTVRPYPKHMRIAHFALLVRIGCDDSRFLIVPLCPARAVGCDEGHSVAAAIPRDEKPGTSEPTPLTAGITPTRF
jgi:hypothetical protein